MNIQVRRKSDGKVFSSLDNTSSWIYEIHFCTSYTTVMVQELVNDVIKDDEIYIFSESPSLVDMIAFDGTEEEGEFV